MKIDLTGVDKAEVLARLYNRSKPPGLGFLHYTAEDMTADQARELLAESTYFDYLHGRVMKIDLSKDVLHTAGYDRDNGPRAAFKAIRSLLPAGAVMEEDR